MAGELWQSRQPEREEEITTNPPTVTYAKCRLLKSTYAKCRLLKPTYAKCYLLS